LVSDCTEKEKKTIASYEQDSYTTQRERERERERRKRGSSEEKHRDNGQQRSVVVVCNNPLFHINKWKK
tara:strand:+ start:245 stop:451 length:207 start_codon:yes stop_codon:yes gene_type:complete